MKQITEEEFRILEKYYDRMFIIVKDRAVVGLDQEMKNDIIDILDKYGYMKGLCSKCNSTLVTVMTWGCRLYKYNDPIYNNSELTIETSEKPKQRKKTNKTKE